MLFYCYSQIVAHHEDLLSQATGVETLEGNIISKIIIAEIIE